MYAVGLALFLILQMVDILSTTVSHMMLYKASFSQAAQAFIGIFPSILNRSLVVAVPFGVLLGLSRLQRDSEIKALLSSGVSPLSLIWPLVLPFALVGALVYWNTSSIVPSGMQKWEDTWYSIYGMNTPIPSQTKYTYAPKGHLYYAGRITADETGHMAQLSGVMVQKGNKVWTAQSGIWDANKRTWTLHSPWLAINNQHPERIYENVVLPQRDKLKHPAPEPDKMSTKDLKEGLDGELSRDTRRIYRYHLMSRYADPFTPIAFALAAGALGLLIRNRAAATAVVLVMIAGFYVVWIMMPRLASAGALTPELTAWIPSLILLSIGFALMFRLRGSGQKLPFRNKRNKQQRNSQSGIKLKRFESYVLEEIMPALMGALATVIVLLVLGALEQIIAPLLAKGANPLLVMRLLALNIPEAVARALPLSLMFATLLGLSRLAADSEIKAALAGGIPVIRLLRPVMILAVGVGILSFMIGEGLMPRAKVEALKVQQQIVFDNPRVAGLGAKNKDGKNLVLTDALGRAISVGSVSEDGILQDLRVVTMKNDIPPREVITAKTGRLLTDSNVLELKDGQRITYQHGQPITILSFETGTLPVQDVQASLDEESLSGGQIQPYYLPLADLLKRTKEYTQNGISAPEDFTALHRKFAEPLAALALTFFAVSLAVFTFRSSMNLGFTWSILLAFAYYATWSVFRVMGENGALLPLVAAYAPNMIALVAGIVLLWLSDRR